MKTIDQFMIGLTFLGMSVAFGTGKAWLGMLQALAAAIYFLSDPLGELWAMIRRRR